MSIPLQNKNFSGEVKICDLGGHAQAKKTEAASVKQVFHCRATISVGGVKIVICGANLLNQRRCYKCMSERFDYRI